MKKIVALVLMLCMLCGCAAMAEDMEQLLALSWDELTPYLSDMGLVGDFDALDLIGLKLFVPTSLVKAEVSEADAQAGQPVVRIHDPVITVQRIVRVFPVDSRVPRFLDHPARTVCRH